MFGKKIPSSDRFRFYDLDSNPFFPKPELQIHTHTVLFTQDETDFHENLSHRNAARLIRANATLCHKQWFKALLDIPCKCNGGSG